MKIRIREYLEKVVEAESVIEVADKYSRGEIVLTADDFTEYEIVEVRGDYGNNTNP